MTLIERIESAQGRIAQGRPAMKVEDRHIEAALRLGRHKSPLKSEAAIEQIKRDPDYYVHRYILAHARTLGKLECAVGALERVGAVRMPGKFMAAEACQRIALEAITQIRSESHD